MTRDDYKISVFKLYPQNFYLPEDSRYLCVVLSDGRMKVVGSATLDDLVTPGAIDKEWTVALTPEYLFSVEADKVVWYQEEFDFDGQ